MSMLRILKTPMMKLRMKVWMLERNNSSLKLVKLARYTLSILVSVSCTYLIIIHQAARQKAQRQPGIWTTPKPPRHSSEHDRDSEHISKKRRVSIPFVQLDEDTGEVVDNATRKSSRSATVQNKHELQSKLKDMEQRRVRPLHLSLDQSEHNQPSRIFSTGRSPQTRQNDSPRQNAG